jgi:hypothetical protein
MPEAKEPKTRALFQFQSRGSLFRTSPCYTTDTEDSFRDNILESAMTSPRPKTVRAARA